MDGGPIALQNDEMTSPAASSSKRVLVVGAGASGMLAAWRAASLGHSVLLVEANPKPGMKIRISGGGKCNLTHEGSPSSILKAFRKEQARFLKPALHAFGSSDIRQLMSDLGVPTYVRENGRVFPDDRPGSANAVVEAFETLLQRASVSLFTGARVMGLVGTAPRIEGLRLEDGQVLRGDLIILATGGASYPKTGTRGEVAGWLKALGVPVLPWFPALAPIALKAPHPQWEGVPFRGGRLVLSAGKGGRQLARHGDDVLFTRTGITGPAALELSRETECARRTGAAFLTYAFTESTPEALDEALLKEQQGNPHLAVRTWLQRWIPERVVISILSELSLDLDQRLKDLPRLARKALVERVTAFPLGEPGSVDLARGEVCAGGVSLQAVDPKTLLVHGWENLKVCGELLDIDGPVGGYNLQAAFSTGFLAGSISE